MVISIFGKYADCCALIKHFVTDGLTVMKGTVILTLAIIIAVIKADDAPKKKDWKKKDVRDFS